MQTRAKSASYAWQVNPDTSSQEPLREPRVRDGSHLEDLCVIACYTMADFYR